MRVSIIIAVKEINEYIYESIPKLLDLDYEEYDIIILPDRSEEGYFPRTKIVATGNVGPAKKRDLALGHSNAEILAFIDDDAYPKRDWLKNAVRHLHDPEIAAVGGPAVTPPGDSFWQRASGAVFLSRFGGGYPERYWPIGRVRDVYDWPSVNLFVRKEIFEKIGGFNSDYWPGEDTKLCLDIIRMGKKIIYDPEVFVWHHRRGGLIKHLRQIGRYGLHRGFFAKQFPETSRRFKYFLPTLFVIFAVMGIPILFIESSLLNVAYLCGMGLYFLALIISFCEIVGKEKKLGVALVSLVYVFLTHIWYGVRFIQGFLLKGDFKSKLRTSSE